MCCEDCFERLKEKDRNENGENARMKTWDEYADCPHGGGDDSDIEDVIFIIDNSFLQKEMSAQALIDDLRSEHGNWKQIGFEHHHLIELPPEFHHIGHNIFRVKIADEALFVVLPVVSKQNDLHCVPNKTYIENLNAIKHIREDMKSFELQTIIFAAEKHIRTNSADNLRIKRTIVSNAKQGIPSLTHASVHWVQTGAKPHAKHKTHWKAKKARVWDPYSASKSDSDSQDARSRSDRMLRTRLKLNVTTNAIAHQKMERRKGKNDLNCFILTAMVIKAYALSCLEQNRIIDFEEFLRCI